MVSYFSISDKLQHCKWFIQYCKTTENKSNMACSLDCQEEEEEEEGTCSVYLLASHLKADQGLAQSRT